MTDGAPFGDAYAAAYDLLYETKDYDAECGVIRAMIERYARDPVTRILDLGCGTGGHAIKLADLGYRVTGVDRAPFMLQRARAKADTSPARAIEALSTPPATAAVERISRRENSPIASSLAAAARRRCRRSRPLRLRYTATHLEQTPIKLYHSRRRRSNLCIR